VRTEQRPIDYTSDFDVCADCLIMIANGEGSDEHVIEMDKQWPPDDGWHLSLGSLDCEYCGSEAREENPELEDCEPWFSWNACHGCGSRLGGDRWHASAWRYTPTPSFEDYEKSLKGMDWSGRT